VGLGLKLLQMLLNLHKKSWIDGLKLDEYQTHSCGNETTIKDMLELAKNYNKASYVFLKFTDLCRQFAAACITNDNFSD